jgi:hypothetical protein
MFCHDFMIVEVLGRIKRSNNKINSKIQNLKLKFKHTTMPPTSNQIRRLVLTSIDYNLHKTTTEINFFFPPSTLLIQDNSTMKAITFLPYSLPLLAFSPDY